MFESTIAMERLFIFVLSLWVHRKPSFQYSLSLLEDLEYAPEAGAADHTEYGAENLVLDKQGAYDEYNAQYEKPPPAARAEVVFAFYYDWMKQSYNEERRDCYYDTYEIHVCLLCYCKSPAKYGIKNDLCNPNV